MTGLQPSAVALELSESAARRPDALALADLNTSITVGELDRHVRALAYEVAQLDGEWVPILGSRTVWPVVAIIACMRAGRAFSVIDGMLPPATRADLIARLGHPSGLVITEPSQRPDIPATMRVIDGTVLGPGDCAPVAIDPEHAAIVNFTSGSTGVPKAVLRSWRALDRTMVQQRDQTSAAIGVLERHACMRPAHFAGGLRSFFTCVFGRELHLLDPTLLTPRALVEEMTKRRIDTLDPPQAVMSTLAALADGRRILPEMRIVTLGGEPTPRSLIGQILSMVGSDAEVWTRYGTTEATGRFEAMRWRDLPASDVVPMGRPVDESMVQLQPVEPGSPLQELVLADPDCIMYLGDPDLTARRLFTDADGMRWWRSGDLVERDDAGLFHFRGRVDDIVNVNDVQVEPLLVEMALRKAPGVRDAAVAAQPGPDGRLRLVGHLVVEPGATPEQVREALRHRLAPAFMPTFLVRHDAFPLTTTGKVDRRALAAADVEPWRVTPWRTPRSAPEWSLLGLCRELLELPELGPDDDLWLSGLDSLGAVELCGILVDDGIAVTPADVLEAPTVALLLERAGRVEFIARPGPVVLNPGGTRRPVFAVPGAGGTAIGYGSLGRALGPDQPFVVVEARGMHSPGRHDRTVEQMAVYADEKITEYLGTTASDEVVLVGHSGGASVTYAVAQLRADRGWPSRVVFVDGAPRPVRTAPITRGTLRGRSWREYPAIALRQAKIARYRIHPGRPKAELMRYTAFSKQLISAIGRYTAAPPRFPCTMVHVENSPFVAAAQALSPEIPLVLVGGDHGSCLHQPHVNDVAVVVAREAEAVQLSQR